MATYDDYLKDLRRRADAERKEYIVPLENEIKLLLTKSAELNQKRNELSTELSNLQREHKRLEEEKYEHLKKEQKHLVRVERFWSVLWGILWSIISGIVGGIFGFILTNFSLFSAIKFQSWTDYAISFAIIGGILYSIFGFVKAKKGCGIGCSGAAIAALVAGILGALLPHSMAFIVLGVLFGLSIYFLILFWNN